MTRRLRSARASGEPAQIVQVVDLLRRNADYRRLFFASVISLGGDWFAIVAVTGMVVELTGRESSSGIAFAANVLPVFLMSPLAGVVADRIDRKRMIVGADLFRVVPALMLIVAAATGQAWLAYLCVATISAASAFADPVASAVVPNLVDREDLSLAQATLSSVWGTMLFVGAGLGGLFTLWFGRNASFVVDAASFALSAVLVLRITRPFRTGPVAEQASVLAHLGEVWRFARSRKVTRAFMVTKGGVGIGNGLVALLPLYATMRFGRADDGIGVFWAARGVGALVGPYAARAIVRDDGRRHAFVCGAAIVCYGATYLLFPSTTSFPVALLLVVLAHAGGGAQWVLSTVGLQATTPDTIRGRVMSLDFGLATLAIGVSSLGAGFAAEVFGLTNTSYGLALLALVYGVGWLVWTRDLWGADHDPIALATIDEGEVDPEVPALLDTRGHAE